MQTLQDSTQPSNIPQHFLNTFCWTLSHTLQYYTQQNSRKFFFFKTWQNITKQLKTIQTSQDFYKTCANLYKKSYKTLYKFVPNTNFTTLYNTSQTQIQKLYKTIKLHNFVILFWSIYICYKTLNNYTTLYIILPNGHKLYKTIYCQHFYTTFTKLYRTPESFSKHPDHYNNMQNLYNYCTALYTTAQNSTQIYKTWNI